jgi:transcription antitermination factor NusG
MLRLADNPPICYSPTATDGGFGDAEWSLPWRVAYTKPRQEKSLARDLIDREITYFLPMVLRETSSGGRRRRNMYPLFASYMFFAGGDEATASCYRTERIVQIINPEPAHEATLASELRSLATALVAAPDKVELYSHLIPGKRVWIKSGPMKGVEGTIVEIGDARKLQLSVSLLGVGALVEIHADLVERA